ncbi:hypothetical protein OQA88_921 [Cercophora sp. LCS_1]
MKRIRDVKQHLRRAHYQPGPGCAAYSSEDTSAPHFRSGECNSQPTRAPGGPEFVAKEAQDFLHKKADRTMSEEEQYFKIFDSLFGATTSSLDPHLGNIVEETMNTVSGFWKERATDIIPLVLKSGPAFTGSQTDIEGLMLRLFDEVKVQFTQRVQGHSAEFSAPDPSWEALEDGEETLKAERSGRQAYVTSRLGPLNGLPAQVSEALEAQSWTQYGGSEVSYYEWCQDPDDLEDHLNK